MAQRVPLRRREYPPRQARQAALWLTIQLCAPCLHLNSCCLKKVHGAHPGQTLKTQGMHATRRRQRMDSALGTREGKTQSWGRVQGKCFREQGGKTSSKIRRENSVCTGDSNKNAQRAGLGGALAKIESCIRTGNRDTTGARQAVLDLCSRKTAPSDDAHAVLQHGISRSHCEGDAFQALGSGSHALPAPRRQQHLGRQLAHLHRPATPGLEAGGRGDGTEHYLAMP